MKAAKAKKLFLKILPFVNVVLFAGAVGALFVLLKDISFSDLLNGFNKISPVRLVLAAVLTILNYAIMIGYDAFGLKCAGSLLKFRRIAFSAFVGDSLNSNLGFSSVVGSTVKMRLYTHWGEKVSTIAQAIAIYTIAYWLGFLSLASFSLFGLNSDSFGTIQLTANLRFLLGALFGLPVLVYIGALFSGKRMVTIWKIKLPIPSLFTGMGLLATGIIDWICTAAVFFILIPGLSLGEFFRFAAIYLVAHLAGMLSQLPGGIAVFETVAMLVTPTSGDHASTAASLLAFRIIFFIAPFVVALIFMGLFELNAGRNAFAGLKRFYSRKPLSDKGTLIMKPTVTVVVPAYNEELSLPSCLEALKNQDYDGQVDILVVNNASSDATAEIAEAAGCRVVHEYQRGYNHAVARGFSEATGEIIACTDADTIVPCDWVASIVKNLSRKGTVACSGVFKFSDGVPLIRFIGWLFGRLNYHLAGANMAVWRSAYNEAGGFSLKVNLGADVELGQRLKKLGKVKIDRSLVVATSARRFQLAFFETIFRYYINDLSLLIFKRPVFYSFTNYRMDPAVGAGNLRVAGTGFLIVLFLFGLWSERPASQLFGNVFAHGKKVTAIALTFDDGPGVSTDSIISILKKYNAHATFFMIGKNAIQHADIVKRVFENGNEIGNHTFSHPLQSPIETRKQFGIELDSAEQVLEKITGTETSLFRPPKGWRTPWMMNECKQKGYTVVTWDVDSRDWIYFSADRLVDRICKDVKPGSIILMHDRLNTGKDNGMSNTVKALPLVLEELTKRGYQFVTISELKSCNNIMFSANDNKSSPLN